MSPTVPFREIPDSALELLASFGAPPSDLYRALANNPPMLEAWITMAWGLRNEASTDRAIRELMILRSAHLHGASYQWADHTVMAKDAGIPKGKIDAIADWKTSEMFSETETIVLTLMDEMVSGKVSDATTERLSRMFTDAEQVELILTAGFYCMVPRVLDALRLEG